MAAELLDIEAKLDTSQVKGELAQLSKTSGLQNLDRAVKTLEQSMKRLTQQMERNSQAQSYAASDNLGTKMLGGRFIRGAGGFLVGRSLSEFGKYMTATGHKTAGERISLAGGLTSKIAGGAAVGSLVGSAVPGVGNVAGAALGAGFGALQFITDELTDSFSRLSKSVNEAERKFEKTNMLSQNLQKTYGERMFAVEVAGMGRNAINQSKVETAWELRRARMREKEKQQDLKTFEGTTEYRNSLKYGALHKVMTKEFREEAEGLQKIYDDLAADAKSAAEETMRLEKRMKTLEQRERELSREDAKSEKASKQYAKEQQKIENQRLQYAEAQRKLRSIEKLEGIEESADNMTQAQLKSKAASTKSALGTARDTLDKLLEMGKSNPEDTSIQSRIDSMSNVVKELESTLKIFQQGIKEQPLLATSPLSLFGATNSLQQMGAYAYKGQEYNYVNYFNQIVNYLVQIRNNTTQSQQTTNTIFA